MVVQLGSHQARNHNRENLHPVHFPVSGRGTGNAAGDMLHQSLTELFAKRATGPPSVLEIRIKLGAGIPAGTCY